jgi:poly(3-hydroxybutyrate) depolymerase
VRPSTVLRRALATAAALLLGASVVPGVPADAATGPAPGPAARRVVLTTGSVHATASGTALAGAVVVRNPGRRPAAGVVRVRLVRAGVVERVARIRTGRVPAGRTARVPVRAGVPTWLPNGAHRVEACVAASCAVVGRVLVDSRPRQPLDVAPDQLVRIGSDDGGYDGYDLWVPSGYDATHRTPTALLVWGHGCGGNSHDDVAGSIHAAPEDSWVVIAPRGRDGDCWKPDVDVARWARAVADVRRRLNIDPRRVLVGGFSSGGDLAYRFAFEQSDHVAGALVAGTTPFRDTGRSAAELLAAAHFRFRTRHVLHTDDGTYPATTVRAEIARMERAGFDVDVVERPGPHFEPDTPEGAPTSGSYYDLRTYLLPVMDRGWRSPGR